MNFFRGGEFFLNIKINYSNIVAKAYYKNFHAQTPKAREPAYWITKAFSDDSLFVEIKLKIFLLKKKIKIKCFSGASDAKK